MGSDKYGEIADTKNLQFEPAGKLACRFAFARPANMEKPLRAVTRVATSYPRALQRFAAEQALEDYEIVRRPGKVEGAVAQGLADAIFDIVETGDSLRANGLVIVKESVPLELGGFWRADAQN
jgi:ATP phosphoribosyltransferase